jgi:predicted RNase H-like HicB family nuclease
MSVRTFTAYVEFDAETNLYVGIVPDVPGAHSIGQTLDELRDNLKEVLELLREEGALPDGLPQFIGLERIEIST